MHSENRARAFDCAGVLERLSDYVDGELPVDERNAVQEHLRGCENCDRFGGAFGAAVAALRRGVGPPTAGDEAARRRVQEQVSRLIR
jgi:anti-sigma factor RsiW